MAIAGSDRLQVCLDLLLLEIEFAFDLVQHFIVDASLIAQLYDCGSLGCQHFLAQAEFSLPPITILLVCFS
jgi:hypothetical protein